MPLPAWPITSTPPIRPSRYPSSSRASCSSSTTTARKSILRGHRLVDGELGDLDRRPRARAGNALELQLVMLAVDRAQPFVDVAQSNTAVERMLEPVFRHADAVVVHLDDGVAVREHRGDRHEALADFPRQAVFD